MSEVAAPANTTEVTSDTTIDPASASASDPALVTSPAAPDQTEVSTPETVETPAVETQAEPAARTLDAMYDDYMAGKADQPRSEVEQVQTFLRQQEERLNAIEQTAQAFPTAFQSMQKEIVDAFGENSPEAVGLSRKIGQQLEAIRQRGEDIYLKPFISELYRFAQKEGVPRRILDFADPIQLGQALIEHGRGNPKDAVGKAEVTKQLKAAKDEGAKATRDLVMRIDPNFKWPEDGTGATPEGTPAKSLPVTKTNVRSKSAEEIAALMSTPEGYAALEQALKG